MNMLTEKFWSESYPNGCMSTAKWLGTFAKDHITNWAQEVSALMGRNLGKQN
jgi:hypothetical protein